MLAFLADPAELLTAADWYLTADPVVSTVVTTMARRRMAQGGALPAVRLCAQELARLQGMQVEVLQHTRLHRLRVLVPPAPVPGELAAVPEEHVDLAGAWFAAFGADADEQAGRPAAPVATTSPTATRSSAAGVARVEPVYTPPAQRRRGWASNAVAELSRRLQADGVTACLYTDQANPMSNRIYAALGYEPVVDMANLVLRA